MPAKAPAIDLTKVRSALDRAKRDAKNRLRWWSWPRTPLAGLGDVMLRAAPSRAPARLTFAGHAEPGPSTAPVDERTVMHLRGKLELEPLTGFVVREGRLLTGSSDAYGLHKVPDRVRFLRKPRRHVPRVASLMHRLAANYYHFLTIVAPRAALLDSAGVPADVPLAVSAKLASQRYFREAVDLGIFAGRQIVPVDAEEVLASDELYLPRDGDPLAGSGEIGRRLARAPARGGRRLFVDRGAAAQNGRRLLNRAEVVARLAPLGFEAVDPGALPLAEQIALFSSADVIVAPHGAALTNVMFMPVGGRVVEIYSSSHLEPCFFDLARVAGLRHTGVLGPAVTPAWDSDFSVDSDAVADAVRAALELRPSDAVRQST
jgi:hypothetical protein